MSMTKRYLESLPADEQDAILGGIDNAYVSPDEWTDDAENEPTEESEQRRITDMVSRALSDWIMPTTFKSMNNTDDEPTDEELAEWALALIEEDNERDEWDDSAPDDEEEDKFTERDEAPLVKPQPKRTDCDGWSI